MKTHASENYLKTHRKKTGLSQRELGLLVGYADEGQVSRHEMSKSLPSLSVALSYEAVFRVSLSVLFPELVDELTRMIEERLAEFGEELTKRNGRGRKANITAQKLIWIRERKGW
jgi:transcriptional regulator with XRE-family HTH domain